MHSAPQLAALLANKRRSAPQARARIRAIQRIRFNPRFIFAVLPLAMLLLLSTFLSRLSFVLLTATVLFVLALNHQAVATLRAPVGQGARAGLPAKAAVVKQKVTLEATGPLVLHVAPAADAWLPSPAPHRWGPALRRALRVPRPQAGIRPAAVFCARLLVVALSPQAP